MLLCREIMVPRLKDAFQGLAYYRLSLFGFFEGNFINPRFYDALIVLIFIFGMLFFELFSRRHRISRRLKKSLLFKNLKLALGRFSSASASKSSYLWIALAILSALGGAILALPGNDSGKAQLAESGPFTRFHVQALGGGEAFDLRFGEPAWAEVRIENREGIFTSYLLQVRLGGGVIGSLEIGLEDGSSWNQDVSFVANRFGRDLKLEFLLYKGSASDKPYRERVFWVNSSLDPDSKTTLSYAISPPRVLNGDMEVTDAWIFGGSFSGNFSRSEWVSPDRSYRMGHPAVPESKGSFGSIHQNISSEEGLVTLSYDILARSKAGYFSEQVLLNGEVVWEDDVSGKGWQRIRVPVMLSRQNNLVLRVVSEVDDYRGGIDVWWDNVAFEAYAGLSSIKTLSLPDSNIGLENRGEPFSVSRGSRVEISSFNFPGFQYDIDDYASHEKLVLFFSDTGAIKPGDASYITTLKDGEIAFLGIRYRSLNPERPDLLGRIILKGGNNSMGIAKPWVLGESFSIRVSGIIFNGSGYLAQMELKKDNNVLASKALARGEIFEYWRDIMGINTQVFRARVDSIFNNTVRISGAYLVSEEPVEIKIGNKYGGFEVINITRDGITLNSGETIELREDVSILNGTVNFRVRGSLAYPYASGAITRGSPQGISEGNLMVINGSNFPGFRYDLEEDSTEGLVMYFSKNGMVKPGDATYTTTRYGGDISFLGKRYEFPNSSNLFEEILLDLSRKMLRPGEPIQLKNGYSITLENIADGKAGIAIRKNGKPLKYGNFTLEEGENFEFLVEFGEYKRHTVVRGTLGKIYQDEVLFEGLRQYSDLPTELWGGRTFGEFEIISITQDRITLANHKTLKFEPGRDTDLLNGIIKIRTSKNGNIAYPLIEVPKNVK